MNNELEVLRGIIENPVNMGKIENYVEIDTIEDACQVNPNLINSILNKLHMKGLVNINLDLVRITSKGLEMINQKVA